MTAFRSTSDAVGLAPPREGEEVGDDASRPGRLGGHLVEVLPELGLAPLRDAVVLQDPLHEHREVEDAGERVVDLVRHARRELAERGEAVGLHQLLLRDLQLLGPLLHLLLEAAGEAVDLRHRLGEAQAHLVEGAGQLGELLARPEGDGAVELHLGHVPRRVREAREGPGDEPAGEDRRADSDEDDGQGGEERRPHLDALDLLVDEAHVEADVEDAEDVLRRGVGVAGRVAARRLVVDGRDHRERPGAVGPVDDAGPRRRVDPHERLLGGVAEEAGLGVLVDDLRRARGASRT